MSDQVAARGTMKSEVPFFWGTRRALAIIREDSNGYALATYTALCDLASQYQSPTFTVSISQIAAHASFSYSAVSRSLKTLEDLGIVSIQRNSKNQEGKTRKSESTYTLNASQNAVQSTPPPSPLVELTLPSGRTNPLPSNIPILGKDTLLKREYIKKKEKEEGDSSSISGVPPLGAGTPLEREAETLIISSW